MTAAPARRMEPWDRSLRAPVAACLVALVGVLVLWHRPFATAESSAIEIRADRFSPRWVRVPQGDCVVVTNRDDTRAALDDGPAIAAGKTVRWCPTGAGIHRTKISGRGGSGGYVIVDPAG